jgi:hypothetical protein
MPKTMKSRLTDLSLSLKVDTNFVEMQIEKFLDKQFERQDVLPGLRDDIQFQGTGVTGRTERDHETI